MLINTVSACTAVTPTVIGTTVSHFLNRKPRKNRPTAQLGYDLGLNLVRRFIEYSSRHSVEEIQNFTQQWIPAPHWVRTKEIEISDAFSTKAAEHLIHQLGPSGVAEVGGSKWWQWRREGKPLKSEWIEMRSDYNQRKAKKSKGDRILLYIHGGAYYFGSVDEHRYQIQRHARKLKARCLAPRYRLAPQFPFPCGLHDAISAYLYLLSEFDPKTILVAGDSAGGGLIAGLLLVLRDEGLPLPAGALLLSPWVDLTHSFPSICDDARFDYIPEHGFVHRPSIAWPPPMVRLGDEETLSTQGQLTGEDPAPQPAVTRPDWIPEHVPDKHIVPLLIHSDGTVIRIHDQIQLYAPNHLLVHPLVSPVLNPSLGGLCPLLVQVGGGELLRDEQVYFAHKAANPAAYAPNEEFLDRFDPERKLVNKYPPTPVYLQYWDDVCHVPHTLSWTKPAKYMYRSVAQFGAWALARAQKRPIEIDEDMTTSGSEGDSEASPVESKNEGSGASDSKTNKHQDTPENPSTIRQDSIGKSGKAGDPLPPFVNHMIRHRIDGQGNVYELPPPDKLPCLSIEPKDIGNVKENVVQKWLDRQSAWDRRFGKLKAGLYKEREEMEAKGMVPGMEGEHPPPTALVRRCAGLSQLRSVASNFQCILRGSSPPWCQ